ncbi:hypothetical protein OC861_004018 [Tilletia horrida]|nr:hypothetical protein OC861_004018 [Tilletia horrida]
MQLLAKMLFFPIALMLFLGLASGHPLPDAITNSDVVSRSPSPDGNVGTQRLALVKPALKRASSGQ